MEGRRHMFTLALYTSSPHNTACLKVEKNIDWAVNVVLMMFANDRRLFDQFSTPSTFDVLYMHSLETDVLGLYAKAIENIRRHKHLTKNALKTPCVFIQKGDLF